MEGVQNLISISAVSSKWYFKEVKDHMTSQTPQWLDLGTVMPHRAWEISIFIQAVVCLSSQLTLLFNLWLSSPLWCVYTRPTERASQFTSVHVFCPSDQGQLLTQPIYCGGEPQDRHMVAGSPPVEREGFGIFLKRWGAQEAPSVTVCVMTKPVCYKKKKTNGIVPDYHISSRQVQLKLKTSLSFSFMFFLRIWLL